MISGDIMKIVFLSNKLTPHQKPFADEMYRIFNSGFSFVETLHIAPEQLPIGWRSVEQPPYLISEERFFSDREDVERIIFSSDVLIYGSAPEDLVFRYLKQGKLAFKYSERIYKTPPSAVGALLRRVKYIHRYKEYHNLYLLCASAYAYSDYVRSGVFHNRAYRWGYYPDAQPCDIDKVISKKKKTQIFWCGRMIGWKHPDHAVKVARRLRDEHIDFSMILAGIGEKEAEIRAMISDGVLSGCVDCIGELTPAQVREYMLDSTIFLFTSDRQEGWGAVLNEAMNAGCAVVASDAAGATPYLISDQVNGLVYSSGDVDMLYKKTLMLLQDSELRERLCRNAYDTIQRLWNPRLAVERIVKLSECILKGEDYPHLFDDGPCSIAPMIKDKNI